MYGPGNEPSTDRVSTGLASGISMGIVVRSNLSEKEKKTGAASFCEPRYGKALTASLTRERTHGIFKSPAIETPPLHPGILGLGLPWNDGLAFKTCLLMHKQMAAFIAISRDLSSYQNRVTLSAEGYPVIEYALTTLDADMVMEGLVMQMRMMRGAGSSIVFPLHESNEWISSTISDKAFEIKINEVKKDGIQPHKMQLFSAHQMGSCRMSPKESEGPVKETGETYEVSNLFVADGSVLPTSLGINPMITIEAMAIMIAKNVNKSLAIM